jgi:hypothetical protein
MSHTTCAVIIDVPLSVAKAGDKLARERYGETLRSWLSARVTEMIVAEQAPKLRLPDHGLMPRRRGRPPKRYVAAEDDPQPRAAGQEN